MGAEYGTSADARNAGMAGGSISNIGGQGVLRRLRFLRCTRHSLRRRRTALFQGVLHRGLYRLHFRKRSLHVQGNQTSSIFTNVKRGRHPTGTWALNQGVEKWERSTTFSEKSMSKKGKPKKVKKKKNGVRRWCRGLAQRTAKRPQQC